MRDDIVTSLVHWMRDTCLPFWATQGVNPATGLAHERVLFDGRPDLAAPLRVRVQCRMVFSFSHACAQGLLPEGGDIADRLWRRLVAVAAPEGVSRGFAHLLSPAGSVTNATRDAYDHAFVLLAASWLLRVTSDPRLRQEIDLLLAFIDRSMTDERGLLREGLPVSLPRRQNPQMHWFEAMLSLHEAAGHCEGLPRARRHHALLRKHLYDPATGTIGEYFDNDWQPVAGPAGDSIEPGHLAEWCWLLRRYETLSGKKTGGLASSLLDVALRSRDPETGLLVDECDRQARTRRGSRRSWLATELAKAWIVEAETGRAGAHAEAIGALETMDRHHLRRPFVAGWVDQLDEMGMPVPGPVPTSILYHVLVAVTEANRVFAR